EERTSPSLDQGCKGCLDVTVAADIGSEQLLPHRKRCGLHVTALRFGFSRVWVHEQRNCRRVGNELAQLLQSLPSQDAGEEDRAREIAAWSIEASYEAIPNWIATGREDNRNRIGCSLGGNRCNGVRDDQRDGSANQISYQSSQTIGTTFR